MKSFFPILGLIFITLKLTAVIDWSWWLVLLPIYGTAIIVMLLIIATVAFAVKSSK